MRILFVSSEYPPESNTGGIAISMMIYATSLAKRGHDVHVLSCKKNQEKRDYTDNGVNVHRRPLINIKGSRRIIQNLLDMPFTYKRIIMGLSAFIEMRRLKLNFDLIEYPDYGAEGWCISLFKRYRNICFLASPVFAYPDLSDKNSLKSKIFDDYNIASKLENFAIRNSGTVISLSHYMVNTLQDSGWLKNVSAEIIPQPIDWKKWDNTKPVLNTEPVVLFVGRIQRNKAPEILAEAMIKVRQKIPNARAIFIGKVFTTNDGPGSFEEEDMDYIEWMKRELPTLDGCEFRGELNRDQLIQEMSNARVFAMPSLSESYSIAALEAMAAGRPVVVTDRTGISEQLVGSKAGTIVPAADPESLANALLPYLENNELANQAGLIAKTQVKKINDPEYSAIKHEEIFQKLHS